MRLAGKVALVTGSSRGIGAACARRLAQEGAAVIVHCRERVSLAEQVASEISKAGGRAVAKQADVTDPAAIQELVEASVQAFGRLDILVNNAAMAEIRSLDAMSLDHIQRQFTANVVSVLLATQAAVRAFGPEGGTVINISSINASRPVPGGSVYCAAKAAV